MSAYSLGARCQRSYARLVSAAIAKTSLSENTKLISRFVSKKTVMTREAKLLAMNTASRKYRQENFHAFYLLRAPGNTSGSATAAPLIFDDE